VEAPGLIYPLLGRLIEEGLIDQTDDGRYKITTKGLDMIKDLESVHNVFQKQFEVLKYYFELVVVAGS
jgi:DNA-binding PadR family transcriptional regulator